MTNQVIFFRAIFDYDLEVEVALFRGQGDQQTAFLQLEQTDFLVFDDDPDFEVSLNGEVVVPHEIPDFEEEFLGGDGDLLVVDLVLGDGQLLGLLVLAKMEMQL